MSGKATPGPLIDHAVDVTLSGPVSVGDGFRPYDRYDVTLPGAGGTPLHQRRDILRVGHAVAVLALDPDAQCFVLIRQFRLAAHLATGKGELVEIAAGRVEDGEDPADAASRECAEEIGASPRALLPMTTFMPTPGVTDEFATLYLALVDSTEVPSESGAPNETEHTRPFLLPVDEAMAALTAPFPGVSGNGFVLIALQWYALNGARVAAFVESH